MGDSVCFLALAGSTRPDAAEIMVRVEADMRARGFVVGEDDPDAVLTPSGHRVLRPGPAAEVPGLAPVIGMMTNGAEFRPVPTVNWGPLIGAEALECPHCGWRPMDKQAPGYDQPSGQRMFDIIGENAAGANFADDAASCLRCGGASGVNGWVTADFLIAGSALALWNWQVVDQVIGPIREIIAAAAPGHPIIVAGYKI